MNLDNINLAQLLPLLIPIMLLELGLLVWALLDIIRRERVKGGNKVIWALVIIFINLIGPILYLILGREDE